MAKKDDKQEEKPDPKPPETPPGDKGEGNDPATELAAAKARLAEVEAELAKAKAEKGKGEDGKGKPDEEIPKFSAAEVTALTEEMRGLRSEISALKGKVGGADKPKKPRGFVDGLLWRGPDKEGA